MYGFTPYDRYRSAEMMFEIRDYRGAARALEELLMDVARTDDVGHGLVAARHLLARAYFHSAQLGRAEATARAILDGDPTDDYAAVLLARTLQRQSRHAEADGVLKLAGALCAPGTTDPTHPDDHESESDAA